MIELNIPGRGELRIEHLVLDVNGTLAIDGQLIEGVQKRLTNLRSRLQIHLITADTLGRQSVIDQQLGLSAVRIAAGNESVQKTGYVNQLGTSRVAAIGQGANDSGMLKAAGLGIAIQSPEGLATETLLAADLLVPNILDALDLFDKPLRLIASLRK